MKDAIIVTKKLGYTYRSGPRQTAALQDISLEIERGSCAAIIGVTGSGKSTLAQHFNGLLRPTAGTVIVDGLEVNAHGAKGVKGDELQALRQRVGMLFQYAEWQLFGSTVYADVAFGLQRMHLGKREVRKRVLDALDTVGLAHHEFASRSPFDLSGGQMRRVALAGVLAMSPTALVLDEPSTGLDAEGRAEFYSYLRGAQKERGVTIILISHDMAEVASLADTLFVLHEGRLVMQGAPRVIFSQPDALRVWGLAVPPLNELLNLLRQQGLAIPDDILTIDEAYGALLALRNAQATAHKEQRT